VVVEVYVNTNDNVLHALNVEVVLCASINEEGQLARIARVGVGVNITSSEVSAENVVALPSASMVLGSMYVLNV